MIREGELTGTAPSGSKPIIHVPV